MHIGGMDMSQRTKCIIAGALAGILNGLFGAGGGLILIPLLQKWIGIDQKQAFATSIAIILPLSVVSYALFHIRNGGVWDEALPYLLGGVAGGAIAGHAFQKMSTKWLHRLFSLLLLYGGLKAVLTP